MIFSLKDVEHLVSENEVLRKECAALQQQVNDWINLYLRAEANRDRLILGGLVQVPTKVDAP